MMLTEVGGGIAGARTGQTTSTHKRRRSFRPGAKKSPPQGCGGLYNRVRGGLFAGKAQVLHAVLGSQPHQVQSHRQAGIGATIYLRVDDVQRTVTELAEQGVEITETAHVVFPDEDGTFGPPGEDEWLAGIRDSEGNLVCLAARRPAKLGG